MTGKRSREGAGEDAVAAPVVPPGKGERVRRHNDTTPIGEAGKTQTVFIHKLYGMLEDEGLNHLIWWSLNNNTFCVVPGEEFSRVLARYFKHTNIASFIRQLNMYGFHKINDRGGGDGNQSVRWEFRHLANQFHKGDLESLKLIKRREPKNINPQKDVVNFREVSLNSILESSPQNWQQDIDNDQQQYHRTLQRQQLQQIRQGLPPHFIQYQNTQQTTYQHGVAAWEPQQERTGLQHNYLLFPFTQSDMARQMPQNSSDFLQMQLSDITSQVHNLQTSFDRLLNEFAQTQNELIYVLDILPRILLKNDTEKSDILNREFASIKTIFSGRYNTIQSMTNPQSRQHSFSHYRDATNSYRDQLNAENKNSFSEGPAQCYDKNMMLKSPSKDVSMDSVFPHPLTYNENSKPKFGTLPLEILETRKRSFQQFPFPIMSREGLGRTNPSSSTSLSGQTRQLSGSQNSELAVTGIPGATSCSRTSSLNLFRSVPLSSSGSLLTNNSMNSFIDVLSSTTSTSMLPSVSELDKSVNKEKLLEENSCTSPRKYIYGNDEGNKKRLHINPS